MSLIDSIVNTVRGVDEVSLYVEELASGQTGYLAFSPAGITFHQSFGNPDEFPASAIVDVSVESDVHESQRYTVTRLFFLKQYAMAFPKKTQSEQVLIGILMEDGQQFSYIAKEGSAQQNYIKIEPYLEYYVGTLSDGHAPTMADELAEIADLHQQGILTDDEFAEAKRQIIARWQQGGNNANR